MSDVYFDRVLALQQELIATVQQPMGDQELQSRLTQPHPGEATYAPPAADVRTEAVPAAGRSVTIRIYQPHEPAAPRPLLVWCHGGAFLGGDLDMPEADAVAREIAHRAGAIVVSVDYRLCVGGLHYPAPNDDVDVVVRWTIDHADDLGADPTRISVGGASAGACLAAGTALRGRDDGLALASVVLAYPVVHPVLPARSSELMEKLSGLTPAMAFAPEIFEPVIENYLGARASDAPVDATPGVADDLAGLPPTLIINCEYDGLRASGERYAEQLRDHGVLVRSELARDVAHGHLNRPALPAAELSLRDIVEWITRHRGTEQVRQ